MTDQNRKTLRSFYCRDYLWELFEQMTHELGCSMDYLVNESMRLYARSRNFPEDEPGGFGGMPGGMPGAMGGGMPGGMPGNEPGYGGQPGMPPAPALDPFSGGGGGMNKPADHRTFERMPSVGGGPPPPPRPNSPTAPYRAVGGPPPAPSASVTPPAPTGGLAGGPPPPPRPSAGPASGGGWQQPPRPPSPTGNFGATPGPGPAAGAGSGTLVLTFNNNRYPVTKDKFVIGRGTQHTDLTIRDGNISRKHCAVIFHNNNYYIKDLGSTNGIEFRGNRIESKKIDEGDVFYLCDYELRFSYER